MIRYIPYKGERYRDDRMNVFNIVEGKLEYHKKQKHKIYHGFFVNFYRNIIELPLADSKFFLKKEFAEQSLKINEPCIRLISNYEAPLDILNDEDIWPSWINWLSHKGLHSALSGYQNFQYDVTPEGGSFNIENRYNDYVIDQELLN